MTGQKTKTRRPHVHLHVMPTRDASPAPQPRLALLRSTDSEAQALVSVIQNTSESFSVMVALTSKLPLVINVWRIKWEACLRTLTSGGNPEGPLGSWSPTGPYGTR